LTNLVSIDSEFKDLDGIIYLKAVQARMAKIFNDFHFQIFVQIFVFNSWPKKQHSLYKKSAGKLSRCKKMLGLGFISFDKAFSSKAKSLLARCFCPRELFSNIILSQIILAGILLRRYYFVSDYFGRDS
jgi:hypothetical protein